MSFGGHPFEKDILSKSYCSHPQSSKSPNKNDQNEIVHAQPPTFDDLLKWGLSPDSLKSVTPPLKPLDRVLFFFLWLTLELSVVRILIQFGFEFY